MLASTQPQAATGVERRRQGSFIRIQARPSPIERFPLVRVHWGVGLAATVALWLFAWWLRAELDASLPPGFPFLTFFPVVILVSFVFGAPMGTLAALLCGITAWYEFVPPKYSFSLETAWLAMLFYSFITGTEVALVHWMQRANARLRIEREANARLAETRELLFRELQHRVSNNLQMVAGMINLQRRQIDDEQARAALDEAARRLATVGRVSRQLYRPDGDGEALPDFLDTLTADVIHASGRDNIRYTLDADPDTRRPIAPDSAIPIALIVAEAVANSIEHGFDGREDGRIAIRLSAPQPDRLAIEVEDDGHGLPANFQLDDSPSLGLRIASLLARQLSGNFALRPGAGGGTLARLELAGG